MHGRDPTVLCSHGPSASVRAGNPCRATYATGGHHEQAGFDVLASVEIDPVHCAVHQFNFPYGTSICRDISSITGDEIRSLSSLEGRKVDVVCGGLPCQGFSEIGKGEASDPRNLLGQHFARIVSELDADFFVIENVRGLKFQRNKQILDSIIESFQRYGYNIVDGLEMLNSSHFGVPQNRKRVFILGFKNGYSSPKYPHKFFNVENYQKDTLSSDCPKVTDAIGDLPEIELYPELLKQDWVRAEYGKPSSYAAILRGLEKRSDDYSYRRLFEPSLLTCSLRTQHQDSSKKRFMQTAPGRREPKSRLQKLDLNGFSPTLRAGTPRNYGSFTAPRPIHPTKPRCITVREAARLHSFPDWFRVHSTIWHGFRQVGNSVPPLLAKAVASQLALTMGYEPSMPTKEFSMRNIELLSLNIQKASKIYSVDPDIIAPRKRKK
ncbi:MAG: DNA cytosine methyltransferase [Cyanothece sp. SIO2G6]|nr:DNA cytosine methyltransferase [Cyanothece sp. SIO2G6]